MSNVSNVAPLTVALALALALGSQAARDEEAQDEAGVLVKEAIARTLTPEQL